MLTREILAETDWLQWTIDMVFGDVISLGPVAGFVQKALIPLLAFSF